MGKIILFAFVAGLIVAAGGVGVWTASKTTDHARAEKLEDAPEREIPVSGGLFVIPPPIY